MATPADMPSYSEALIPPIHPTPQTRFRFKRKRDDSPSKSPRPAHRTTSRHHHRHHHHHTPPASEIHDPHLPDTKTAFLSSLFDALADDEGAAYWESVYGQPIHTYAVPTAPGPDGELERMGDEEYAAYVRGRMWERTREGAAEGRRRAAAEREVRRERERAEEEARKEWAEEEARVREREDRRGREEARAWRDGWRVYVRRWEEVMRHVEGGGERSAEVPWPSRSGVAVDVSAVEIEQFFRRAAAETDVDPRALLKIERVRWHPDKMQQRFHGRLDKKSMTRITAIFQVIDDMWAKLRKEEG